MEPRDTPNEGRARIVRELSSMLRRQARKRWNGVRVARRSEQGHQVWRFRTDSENGERFLHVSTDAMDGETSSSRVLFQQLRAGRWLNRLDEGGETSLRLRADGQVEPHPARQ